MIESLTIDIHRLGDLDEAGVVAPNRRYIALTGSAAAPVERKVGLTERDLRANLHALRYPAGGYKITAEEAIETLVPAISAMLPLDELDRTRPVQLDLVLGAAELWAIPFELCLLTTDGGGADDDDDDDDDGGPGNGTASAPVVLTRRIRQGFVTHARPWPVTPRVAFFHAPVASDLPQTLVTAHRDALAEVLIPWAKKDDPEEDGTLVVKAIVTPADVGTWLREAEADGAPFTHVHVLAHGKSIEDPVTGSRQWGVRLGDAQRSPSAPEELADQFDRLDGGPVVVTLAICDAGNAANPAFAERSFAQELHSRGVPVVLAPQLPLTQPGSTTLTANFYRHLFDGDDVRMAFHHARQQLRRDDKAGHDWLSITAYMQIPEGYGDHLEQVGIKRDMARLRAASQRLKNVVDDGGSETEFEAVEHELSERRDAIEARIARIPARDHDLVSECHGVLGSNKKRLAHLHRTRSGQRAGRPGDEHAAQARSFLESALQSYSDGYEGHIQNHWLGVQLLSLKAVTEGAYPHDVWVACLLAAKLDIAGASHFDSRSQSYWAHGTVAELHLLAAMHDDASLPEAVAALTELRRGVAEAPVEDDDAQWAVPSTIDQLRRYVDWWTIDNGYFPGCDHDLSEPAKTLIEVLERSPENHQEGNKS